MRVIDGASESMRGRSNEEKWKIEFDMHKRRRSGSVVYFGESVSPRISDSLKVRMQNGVRDNRTLLSQKA
jgi:hypothetical protein